MIFRATRKVLNLNRIKPERKDSQLSNDLPGEWYVDLISLGKPGKFGLQFLHHPTKISLLIEGRSIKKTFLDFKNHLTDYLKRHDYEFLIDKFEIDSELEIYSTNSRSMLAIMRQIKETHEYHCLYKYNSESIDFKWLEDIHLDFPFSTKDMGNKFTSPKQILKSYNDGNKTSS